MAHLGTNVRLAALLVVLAGCDSSPPAEPLPVKSATIGRSGKKYPPADWAAIRDDTSKAAAVDGATPITRSLIARLTPSDPIAIALRFAPNGTEAVGDVTLAVTGGEPAAQISSSAGVYRFAPIKKPGTYRVRLRGKRGEASFESAEHTIEIVPLGRKALGVRDLEGIASRFIAKLEKMDAPPKRTVDPVDDVDHNVVFRYADGDDWLDIAMTPHGALRGAQRSPRKPAGDAWGGLFDRSPR